DAAVNSSRLVEQLRRRAERVRKDPRHLLETLRNDLTPADTRIVDDRIINYLLLRTYREAVAEGPDGWIDDVLALRDEWGFDLSGIKVPVRLWHGADDQF